MRVKALRDFSTKNYGAFKKGERGNCPDHAAKVFIRRGLLEQVKTRRPRHNKLVA